MQSSCSYMAIVLELLAPRLAAQFVQGISFRQSVLEDDSEIVINFPKHGDNLQSMYGQFFFFFFVEKVAP